MMQNPVDSPERRYKVVVWATGRVGKLAIRTIADRPNLDLVGVWVHSESKDGQDAGALAEIDLARSRLRRATRTRYSEATRTVSSIPDLRPTGHGRPWRTSAAFSKPERTS